MIGELVEVNVGVCDGTGVRLGVMLGVQVEKIVAVTEAVLVGVSGVGVMLGAIVLVENGVGEGEPTVTVFCSWVAVGCVFWFWENLTRNKPAQ